jgi:UDP-N-acetylglucosamine 4,6-dehydratase
LKVLVTGGCGSIGRAILNRYYGDWDISVFSRDEYKHATIKSKYPEVRCIVGDVRDYYRVRDAVAGQDVVIHAAAMKRIEICETYPTEAVKTNILGTENVVRASLDMDIPKLITLSTDKAVDPINIYGMTKRIAEKITTDAGYNCTRYGNVFGTRGSVVEIFARQKASGLRLSVTDPTMTRFILTRDNAVDLIILAMGQDPTGSIFVAKCSATTIEDIAKSFDTPYDIIGPLGVEKQHESLLTGYELFAANDYDRYYNLDPTIVGPYKIEDGYTSENTDRLTTDAIRSMIKEWENYD